MSCDNTVQVWVEDGPDSHNYREVTYTCGSTGIYGQEVRCEDCSTERPWYICPHGKDISSTGYCGRCELDG